MRNIFYAGLLLCLFFNLFNTPAIYSQNFVDIIEGGYDHPFNNEYVDSSQSFNYPGYFLALRYPKVLKNGDVLLTKFSHTGNKISEFASERNSESFYISFLELAYHKKLSDRIAFEMALFAKVGAQTGYIGANCFVFPVAASFKVKKSEDFSWGLGCLYSYEMFGHFVVPTISWDWKISEKMIFKGDFPIKGYLMYQASERIGAGIFMSSTTSTLRMSKEYNNDYMTRACADASVFTDIYLTKSIVFRIKAGYSFMRSVDLFEDGDKLGMTLSAFKLGDNRTQLNSDINDVPFVQFSLFYRYHY